MKAVLYCRVSSQEQAKNLSLPTQEKACREYCARHGYEVDRLFVDAESALSVARLATDAEVAEALRLAALGAWLDDAAQRFAQCMRSEGAEGIAAFRERRSPAWAVTLQAADVARLHGRNATPSSPSSPSSSA